MARMIPDKPREFKPESHEDIMFEELNRLSDEYYVFHSFSIVTIQDNIIKESETDFVIFHPQKGIICLEAKAGQVKYEDGYWKYGSGKTMKNDGPYNQASKNMWNLKDCMVDHGLEYEYNHCKLLSAVWFPDIPWSKLEGIELPQNAKREKTLTSEAFGRIEEEIERIFEFEPKRGLKTCLSPASVQKILERVLAPSFNLITLGGLELEHTKNMFRRMLTEQVALLNYLEEQNHAVINGLAGTGKTVMAVEKARRHAEKNEEVLFLCYNSFLNIHLRETYQYPHVSFYTIDGLACKLCKTEKPDYQILTQKLEEMYVENSFPYKHVIIDEGQDFGKNRIEDANIIDLLKMNVIDNEKHNGTFYLFYDKNQRVQSQALPKCIDDADCKLTLYRNCRNTENIAITSLRLLGRSSAPKLINGAVRGDLPEMGFCRSKEEAINMLNSEINKFIDAGFTDITILTCKTEDKSIISDYCENSKYKYSRGYLKFTTCRKFKGLESDIIIVIDIDANSFNEEGEYLMYVGTSRARYKLSCIVNMTEDECIQIMENKDIKYSRNIPKSFATAFNSKILK